MKWKTREATAFDNDAFRNQADEFAIFHSCLNLWQ